MTHGDGNGRVLTNEQKFKLRLDPTSCKLCGGSMFRLMKKRTWPHSKKVYCECPKAQDRRKFVMKKRRAIAKKRLAELDQLIDDDR